MKPLPVCQDSHKWKSECNAYGANLRVPSIFRSSQPDLPKCNIVCLFKLLLDYFITNMSTLLPQFGNVPNYPSTLKNGHVAYLFKQQPKSCSAKPEKVQQILRDSHSFDIVLLALDRIYLDFIKLNKSARPKSQKDLAAAVVQTVITACYSPIPSTVTPPITSHHMCVSVPHLCLGPHALPLPFLATISLPQHRSPSTLRWGLHSIGLAPV